MIKKLTLTLFLLTVAFLGSANAQTVVAPEKLAALKEITTLLNADDQFEQLVEVFSAQMHETRMLTVKAVLKERTDLSPAERKQLEESLTGGDREAFKSFEKRLMAKLDYRAMMDEMMFIVYDKFFTLEELKDLIVFYKSPTGQKMLKQMSAVAAESMKVTQEKLLPKLMDAVKAIEQEDRKEIEQKIEAKKPRTKNPETK